MGTTRLIMVAALVVVCTACSGGATETSTTAQGPGAESSTTEPRELDGPPPLVIHTGQSSVETYGFDYCWSPGGCADSFGAEVPTSIHTDTQDLTLSWIVDGALTAAYRANDDACPARLAIEVVRPGSWSLAIPTEPGTHRIDLHGEAEGGSTRFAILVSSSAEGPPLLPVASVWWPASEAITDDAFLVGAEFHGIDADSEVEFQIVSSDGITTVVPLQLYPTLQGNSGCVRLVEGETAPINGVDSFGAPPLQVTLLVRSGNERYQVSWEWPRDVGPDGYRTSTLHPANDG